MIVTEASWRFKEIEELIKSSLFWDNGQRAQWRHVLTVLNRATKSDHGTKAKHAKAFLNYIIRHYAVDFAPLFVDVALAEPDGKLPETMAATAQELGDDAIEAIESSLPEITVRLMDVVLVFAQRLVALRMAALSDAEQSTASIDDKTVARTGAINALNSLSVSLANLHRHDEALVASEQAVSLCRTFESGSPERFRRILVKCLISLGAALNALHRQNEALRVMQEVIELNRVMAAENPREFLPSLAMSLANVGTFLSQGGHFIDALSASEEALTLYRQLAIEKPGEFDYEFSGTLINLSSSLADVDRRGDALEVAEEAVATYRKLARDRPDEFVPALAKAVGALGLRMLAVGRNADAMAAATEVCTIYRSLATDRPRQFLSGLAHGLKDSGVMLLRCGKKMESLDALHESCSLYGELVLQRPVDFLPELALALGARSDTLSSLDRYGEAAESAREGLAAVLSMLPKIEALFRRSVVRPC